MKATSEPGTTFLFGDGMHLVHQNVSALCWGDPKEPPILKTNTGRQRLNILGAFNPDSHIGSLASAKAAKEIKATQSSLKDNVCLK